MLILLVEDDGRLAAVLSQGLSEEGHRVHVAKDGPEGLAMAQSAGFDVIVMDVMLPGLSGLKAIQKLRAAGNRTPILILTALDAMSDVVRGLDLGADDYLTKPFAFEELLARLRAVSRRGPIARPVLLELADLKLDSASHTATRGSQKLSLTPTEFSLLELLLRNSGRPLSRNTILESVWGFDADVEENTVEVFVKLLRSKVDAPFQQKLIHTVRGIGYCLRLPEEQA